MEKYDNVKQNVKHVMDNDMGSYNQRSWQMTNSSNTDLTLVVW